MLLGNLEISILSVSPDKKNISCVIVVLILLIDFVNDFGNGKHFNGNFLGLFVFTLQGKLVVLSK
jgi:hypothetical protein